MKKFLLSIALAVAVLFLFAGVAAAQSLPAPSWVQGTWTKKGPANCPVCNLVVKAGKVNGAAAYEWELGEVINGEFVVSMTKTTQSATLFAGNFEPVGNIKVRVRAKSGNSVSGWKENFCNAPAGCCVQ